MELKEIQNVLKQARAAIASKDFKEAQKRCKAILKEDRGNYNALVFYGVAAEGLDQPDQAVAAYVKATEVAPDQALAWQGLCRFYERTLNTADQKQLQTLRNVYRKLVDLSDEAGKKQEYATRLYGLAEQQGSVAEIVDAHKLCVEVRADETSELWGKLAAFLVRVEPTLEQPEVFTAACKYCLCSSGRSANLTLPLWTKYIMFLWKHASVEFTEEACLLMASSLPSEPLPYEVLARIYLDFYCGEAVCPLTITESDISAALLTADPECGVSRALLALPAIREGGAALLRALEPLEAAVSKQPLLTSVRVLLADVCCHLHRYDAASRHLAEAAILAAPSSAADGCSSGASCVTPVCMAAIVRRASLLEMNCAAAATVSCTTEPDCVTAKLLSSFLEHHGEHWKAHWLAGLCALQQGAYDSIVAAVSRLTVLSEAHARGLEGALALSQGQLETAEQRLLTAIGLLDTEPLFHLWLGRTYAVMPGRQGEALSCLMKSAKLDPFDSSTFLQLGHHYTEVALDKERALRCYKKAYDLDPDNAAAGAAAVDAAFAFKQEETGVYILHQATERAASGSCKWAWLRFGLYKLKSDDHDGAAQCFQCALRADPRDSHCWECLADVYFNRGSYTAALKAFTRARELNEASTYSLFKIAQIKEMLRENDEAISLYKSLLEVQPGYVPALKGIGDAYMSLAKSSLEQFLDVTAIAHCQSAIDCYYKALCMQPDLVCLWKLLGDICILLYPVAATTVVGRLSLPAQLLLPPTNQKGRRDDLVPLQSKRQLLNLGCRCYSQAVRLAPDSAAAWHDLGVAFYRLSLCKEVSQIAGEHATGSSLIADAAEVLQKAEYCLKKAISLDSGPSSSSSWNVLGLVEASPGIEDKNFAQHCFIKAIHLQSTNVVAWANLGAFYLINGKHMLAHQAFSSAQSCDPEYAPSWIGQARVARILGKNEEAMDLMRHATGLGHHLESLNGYADCVGEALRRVVLEKKTADSDPALQAHYHYSIVQMAAVPVASDALARYTRRQTEDAAAFNTYGLLLERQGLFILAERALARALELSHSCQDGVDDTGSKDENALSYMVNYMRVLSRLGRNDESLELCQSLSWQPCDLAEACQLALLNYSAGRYQESYQGYDQALHMATDDEDKSEVLAAMGMVAYKCNAYDLAKTALFRGIQVSSPPSTHCVAALCAFGIAQHDEVLASAAMAELQKIAATEHVQSLSSLTASTTVKRASAVVSDLLHRLQTLQGNTKHARNTLLKVVHLQPSSVDARCRLLQWSLERGSVESADAAPGSISRCAAAAVGRRDGKSSSEVVLALSFLAFGRPHDAVSAAQKAVHRDPSCAQHWLLLVTASHAASQAHGVAPPTARAEADAVEVRVGHTALEKAGGLRAEDLSWMAALMTVILYTSCGPHWNSSASSAARDACAAHAQRSRETMTQDTAGRSSGSALKSRQMLDALDAFARKDLASMTQLSSAGSAPSYVWLLLVRHLAALDCHEQADAACRQAMAFMSSQGDRAAVTMFALHLAAVALNAAQKASSSDATQKWQRTTEEALNAAQMALTSAAGSNAALLILQAVSCTRALSAGNAETRRARSLLEKVASLSNIPECRGVARRCLLPLYEGAKSEADKRQVLLQQAQKDGDGDFAQLCSST